MPDGLNKKLQEITMRILHTADLHINDKNIEEADECLRHVVDTAYTQSVDLIVIAGDTFDSRDVKLDSKAAKLAIKTVSALAEIAPVAIITGTPSHDGAAPEILRFARGKHLIHVSAYPEQIYLTDGDLNQHPSIYAEPTAVLTMIPTPTKQFFNEGDIQTSNEVIAQGLSGLFAGFGAQAAEFHRVPHLLVGHWNVSGARLSTGQTMTGRDIDISIDQMRLTNASAHLLGHIHLSQQLGEKTFYSGSLFPLNWGENHDHGFYLHEFNADKLYQSTFIKTPCRKLLRFAFDTTKGEQVNIPPENINGAYVRIDVTAWQDEAATINRESIHADLLRWGAADVDVRLIRMPRQTVRSESVLKVETLKDKLIAMAALKDETVPESILAKADALESSPADELIREAI